MRGHQATRRELWGDSTPSKRGVLSLASAQTSGCYWAEWRVSEQPMVWSFDDKEPYNDPAVAALRDKASGMGLELRLTHLGTRGQLAFAVPVEGLDYWRASLHIEGKRGAVAYELRNTSREAAQAVLTAYERSQRDAKPPA